MTHPGRIQGEIYDQTKWPIALTAIVGELPTSSGLDSQLTFLRRFCSWMGLIVNIDIRGMLQKI